VGLAAALRLFPVWFGLPYLSARPDEETAVGHALGVLGGDLNPHFFHWPSLTFYLFAAVYGAASWARRAWALDPALTDVQRLLIARTCVALAGTLTVVALFGLARRMADQATGLLAALFFAVAILHVRESHFAMTDVLMTLLVTVSLALLVRALGTAGDAPSSRARSVRWFGAAGLAGGLATSTKYGAAAILAGMAAAQLLWLVQSKEAPWRPGAWKPSIAFLAAFGCGFLIATPYALLDFKAFEAGLQFDFTHLSEGHGVQLGYGWSYHLIRSLPLGVGLPTCVAALVGVIPLARHHGRQACVIGAFAAAFYASIGSGYTVFFRYVLPLVPIACLSAAVAVRYVGPWLARQSGVSNGAALALLAALIGGPALVNSAWLDLLLAKTDTRVLAARWLAPRLKPEESLHEAGGQYTRLELPGVRFHRWSLFDPVANSFGDPDGRTPDWLVFAESPLWTYALVPWELRQLALNKYVLVQVFPATKGPAMDGRGQPAFYDLQDAFFLPLTGFSTVERPGPTLLIYRRGDAPPVGDPR
jgi:4-amino-4-deoxy-L-arabinose transferase-like glycosyltransferase